MKKKEMKSAPARMTAGLIISIRDYVSKMDALIAETTPCDSDS